MELSNCRRLLVFVICLWGIGSGAKEFPKPLDLYGSTEAEMRVISSEIHGYFLRLHESMKNSDKRTPDEDIVAIQGLAKYALMDSAAAIWRRLKFDIASPAHLRSEKLREIALDALLAMITEKEIEILEDMLFTEQQLRQTAQNHPNMAKYLDGIGDKLGQFRSRVFQKPEASRLPSWEAVFASSNTARVSVLKSLRVFRDTLAKKIKGQDEVIQALIAIEWENRFLAATERLPDVIYLMGSPGTGKDTTAEAFADALNGGNGDYEDHLFRMPILRGKEELWLALGSVTGYKGSDSLPPFIRFLVNHSGGRYLIQNVKDVGPRIVQNSAWKGDYLVGFARPDQGVVFINEFHNWSRGNKDVLVKQALEKGIFTINNPNGGVEQIQVPIRFVIATNEGIGLVTSRESNGQRHGQALSYDEMMQKWERVHTDKERLKADILTTNGAARGAGGSDLGISEELLNRIPDRYLMLMRPLSPKHLQSIALQELQKVAGKVEKASSLNPGINLTWDDQLPVFIQEYGYVAENNARPMKDKVKSLVLEPLIGFLRSEKLPTVSSKISVHLTVNKNPDGTTSLGIDVIAENGQELGRFNELMPTTLKDIPAVEVSDEEIERLSALPDKIKSRVFGLDDVADRISERVISLANQKSRDDSAPRSASTLVLMGLSSTGKTELAKAITEAITGDEKKSLTIDFSQVQTLHDFKARILGLRDVAGNPIPSDLMMHYDRNNGDIVVIFDELSNVRDPDLLKSLYDFFREPILRTFSDGVERSMSRVKVIVTGNSGIELYRNVPRDVPMEQQMMAWDEISRGLARNPELQRSLLERSFPEPLITRWGANNVFFVPPHSYRSLKQLTMLKLKSAFDRLKPQSGRRGWLIGFASSADIEAFVHAVVERSFNLREQGASIDSFVKDDILAFLEAKLLRAKVPSGTKVLMRLNGKAVDIYAEGKLNPVARLSLEKPKLDDEDHPEVKKSAIAQTLTAYHEVGHAVLQKVLMRGLSEPTMISIVPGVARIGQEWIAYAGVAHSRVLEESRGTREFIVRQIAILAGGETAERLATVHAVHSAGKSNDMKRATTLAEAAILVYGLSEVWGTEAVPAGQDLRSYVAGFSEAKRSVFEAEVKRLIDEGRHMAEAILADNFEDVVVPMSRELAKQGILRKAEMEPFFQPLSDLAENWSPSKKSWWRKALDRVRMPSFGRERSSMREGVLKKDYYQPEAIADVAEIVAERKRKAFAKVTIPDDAFLLLDEREFLTSSCVQSLLAVK